MCIHNLYILCYDVSVCGYIMRIRDRLSRNGLGLKSELKIRFARRHEKFDEREKNRYQKMTWNHQLKIC